MDHPSPASEYQGDVEAVGRIEAVAQILDVVCNITGMGFAAVARVTESRWIACGVRDKIGFGLQPGGELKLETTICNEIRQHGAPVIISNVAEDGIYCGHPTPALYGFQSYISVPIVLKDGSFFGTLCSIDPNPHMIDRPEVAKSFGLFAELIALHLGIQLRLTETEAALAHEREKAELREQFIAVIGHDLRNPLASVAAGIRIIGRQPQKAVDIAPHMERSVARMSHLIDDVLDFARGRLGSGLSIEPRPGVDLAPTLDHVVEEVRSAHPDHIIETDFTFDEAVTCDPGRIGQLLSNLLANAVVHGAPVEPVRVAASSRRGMFELSVANGGEEIPQAARENLFLPFFRNRLRPNHDGVGLGLFIVAEIAKAHGGTVGVSSSSAETRFTFRMPTGAAVRAA